MKNNCENVPDTLCFRRRRPHKLYVVGMIKWIKPRELSARFYTVSGCVWRGIATLPSFLLIRHHFILADFTKLQTKLLATTDYKKSLFFSKAKMLLFAFDLFFSLYYYDVVNIVIIAAVHFVCLQIPEIWDYKLDTQPVFSDRPKLKLIIVQL